MKPSKQVWSWSAAKRLFITLWQFYPRLLPAIMVLIILNASIMAIPAIFMQRVVAILENAWTTHLSWEAIRPAIYHYVFILAGFYAVALLSNIAYNQLLAFFTQGVLDKFREKMFSHMQKLPMGYFDTHKRGDIMSTYTNDVEALRQFINEAFPQLCVTVVSIVALFCIMVYFSVWMSLVVLGGSLLSIEITRKIGSRSARYFMLAQETLAATEGVMEETITGSKVIKVFTHESKARKAFDTVNTELYNALYQANQYSNTLMPILNNVSYLIYIVVASAGGAFLEWGIPNVSFSGLPFSLAVMIPFLGMSRQFAASIQQISPQINAVVMAMAGASRIFSLWDEKEEIDEGTVTLVPVATGAKDGRKAWAWKIPGPTEDTLRPLQGEVTFQNVDFSYVVDKPVLHQITLTARPGQKIALVGATGAGKTTITNMLNRFYEIAGGTITYDGIPLNQIKKSALRKSLGMVLQDTVLFTASVMENIRYGRLDAADEEVIAAAKTANADAFIRRLQNGYDTVLEGDGANLSQGQRQLINIARAALSKAPVLVMDEATSSVDTITERQIQEGMDALMKDRTTFVIAHRLSTIRNSDMIMVLEHGRIIERGTHTELLQRQGRYYELYTGKAELD